MLLFPFNPNVAAIKLNKCFYQYGFFFSAQSWPPTKILYPKPLLHPIIICALHKLMTHPLSGGLFLIHSEQKMLAHKFCEIACGWGKTRGKNRFLKVSNGSGPH